MAQQSTKTITSITPKLDRGSDITMEAGAEARDPDRVRERLVEAVLHWAAKGNEWLKTRSRAIDLGTISVQVVASAKIDCNAGLYVDADGKPNPKLVVKFKKEQVLRQPVRSIQHLAPHEVAHLVAQVGFGLQSRHGPEWRWTVSKLFGKQLETKPTDRKRTGKFVYYCKCENDPHRVGDAKSLEVEPNVHVVDAKTHVDIATGISPKRCNICGTILYGGIYLNERED